ncbi:O-antigen ligase [Leptolyngbya sp. CCNP1308]|uniref:O-antigen ligase family protein n=1 Tax=Leptolyngbya sp. CCNP1308 TaxID=3110255 RepID=UPI002B220090|nr:O-antigen ligase [Leptolyngbya sp. CCNP1308]MEA5449343.1 O-antigen ligase [Leptolyngbya sp. CCNP1308]
MKSTFNRLEKWFVVFAVIFLTGILRWASLFVSPDPMSNSVNMYNPFDPINSLIQHAIYAITLFFLVARPKTTFMASKRSLLIWALLILAVCSFIWSDFPDWSLRKGITTIQTTYFSVYFASRFNIKQQVHILVWALGIVALFVIAFSLAFPSSAIETGSNAGALRGPFTQKNLLARIATLGVIVFLVSLLERKMSSWFLWIGLFAQLLIVLLTTSKTALLLLFTIFILIPIYKSLKWKMTVAIPILITAVLFLAGIAMLVSFNWESYLTALGRDPGLSGRTGLWEAAIDKIKEKPWIGYGYQGFWQEGGGATEIWKQEGYKPPHAHNGYINIALDLGLVGLFIFLFLIIKNYIKSIVYLRFSRSSIGLWPLLYITFFGVYNYSENTIIEHNSIFWMLIVSVVISINNPSRFTAKGADSEVPENYQRPNFDPIGLG